MAKVLKNQELKSKLGLEEKINIEDTSTKIVMPPSGKKSFIDKDMFNASEAAKEILAHAQGDASQIRSEAKQILAEVENEMEVKRQEGYAKGYQEGLAQVSQFIIQVKKLREKLFTDNEKEMVKLVFTIAEKVIGDQIQKNDKAILGVIKQAIIHALGRKIIIHLNPQDYERARENETELFARLESDKTVALRSSENVSTGGCIVESEVGTLDAQLETQLSAIKQALGI